MSTKKVVFVEGTRTPFLRSNTDYNNLMSYQLGAFAIKGLLDKTGIDPNIVDRVVMGTTISNVKTGNVAREAALGGGVPKKVPCHTVTQACISANQAIASGYNMIQTREAEVVIAGGTDCVSDAPILFNKKMRKKLMAAQKLRGFGDTLKFIFSLRPSDFKPEAPAVAEYTTGRRMGDDCEILAAKFGVGRREQDEFAVRSHQLAAKAEQDGYLAAEITPVSLPPKFKEIKKDNGIRGDSTVEKASRLAPAFSKPHGTLTAANSSFLTDGATAALIMTEEKALELGLKPKAVIKAFAFSAQDLYEELLLGPAYSIPKVLKATGLSLDDIDVIELHEAFAGQVLANIKALADEEFCRHQLGWDGAVGQINMNKLNLWGGSLALGHPFGATGARILTTCANRLIKENGRYGLLAACAAGAHGHAMLIERYQG
ncbi:MAG: acetyl-CoA C-acyltransferase [Chitinophagales bacterium]|nr:acetyl-CoA C-acyltransferase [Chitinophagales bacterium]